MTAARSLTDVTVVGAGIAAAAAVRTLLDEGRSVTVVAPSSGGRDNRIGETLAPSARPELEALGVWKSFLRTDPLSPGLRFSSWGTPRLVRQEESGWCLHRRRFEALLWDLGEQHAVERRLTQITTRVTDVQREGDTWRLDLQNGSSLTTRFLLDASGRAATVARRRTARHRHQRLLAAYAFLGQIDPGVEPTAGVLVEAVADGWWYSALTPDRRLVVAFFFDPTTLPSASVLSPGEWRSRVEGTTYTRRRIETAGYALGSLGPAATDAGSAWLDEPAGDGWAAAGDAAASFDPLSSHGITAALWAGRTTAAAAHAALDGDPGPLDRYRDTLRGSVALYRRQLRSFYAAERRFADEPFWRLRSRSAT